MRIVILALPIALLLVPLTTSESKSPSAATFQYTGPAAAQGTITGSCEAGGLLFAPGAAGSLRIAMAESVWEDYNTTYNETVLWPTSDSPVVARSGIRQTMHATNIPASNATLKWGKDSRVSLFLPGFPTPGLTRRTDDTWLDVRFQTSSVLARPPATSVDAYGYYIQDGDSVVGKQGGIGGWNRLTHFASANLEVIGDMAVYIESATLAIDGGPVLQAPPKETYYPMTPPNDAVSRSRVDSHYIVLRVAAGRIAFPNILPDAACGPMTMDIQGNFTALGATGNVSRQDQSLDFDRKEFTIDGNFTLEEAPADTPTKWHRAGTMSGRSEGEFRAVGIDFVIPQGFGPVGVSTNAVLVVTVAAAGITAIGFMLLKGFGFFTRLDRAAVEDLPSRTLIMETLKTEGWAGSTSIARTLGMAEPTVRYHLRVLTRGNIVIAKGHHKARLYCLAQQRNAAKPLLLGGRRIDIPANIMTAPIRQRDLIGHLTRLGHGRSACWYALRRWEIQGQLAKERRGKEVWYQWRA